MAIRYSVVLIPEPFFTARVYRARQLVCGQYASWAAEMHMLHLPLAEYFECTDAGVEPMSTGLARIAQECRHRIQRFPLLHRGVSTSPQGDSIHLDFTVSADPRERNQRQLNILHLQVVDLLGQTEGVALDQVITRDNFHPYINLMQYANLQPAVFDTAVEFARAVLRDLQVPQETRAWQMALVRFESGAAGRNWQYGSWAADLRWQILATYPL